MVFLWCSASWRTSTAQDDGGAFHYSSFSGPVSGDAEEISVPRSVFPYPYQSAHEQENDMTFDYVAKPDYSFVYGVEDPELGKSHKHAETRDGDVVKGEYSVLEPDGSIRRVVYTSDAKNGFRATVITTPAEKGWSLPPQPFSFSEEDHVGHMDEHEHVSEPEDGNQFPNAEEVPTNLSQGEPYPDEEVEERLAQPNSRLAQPSSRLAHPNFRLAQPNPRLGLGRINRYRY